MRIIAFIRSVPQGMWLIFFLAVIVISMHGCSENPPEDIQPEKEQGAWVNNSRYKWDHDGEPYTSEYCKVFSDSATWEMKVSAGEFADEKFAEILEMFNYTRIEDFRYPEGNERIHIYLNMTHAETIAAAYWGTVIFTVRRHNVDLSTWDYLFLHELTHAFEYLIEGRQELGTDVWFREGIAIYCGGGRDYIRDTTGLNNWLEQNASSPNKGNPVCIHQWEDFPEGSDIPGYYTVFEVVMEYILDPDGMNKSLDDIQELFYRVREGNSFPESFQQTIGLSLEEFEAGIMDELKIYLAG